MMVDLGRRKHTEGVAKEFRSEPPPCSCMITYNQASNKRVLEA